jgi:hypothetical protein
VEDRYEVTPSWRCLGWGRHRHQLISRARSSALRQTLGPAPVPARLFLPAVVRRSRPSVRPSVRRSFQKVQLPFRFRCHSAAASPIRSAAEKRKSAARSRMTLGKTEAAAPLFHPVPTNSRAARTLSVPHTSRSDFVGERIFIVFCNLALSNRGTFLKW